MRGTFERCAECLSLKSRPKGDAWRENELAIRFPALAAHFDLKPASKS
jgi:hypothetical protein